MTAIKLIDAWYQKGPVSLRLKNTTPPQLDKSYAEQIVAYCLLENFLAEDFHYTAYKTNSYFKVGSAPVKGDEILVLNKIRYRDLPSLKAVDNDSSKRKKRKSGGDVVEDDVVEIVPVDNNQPGPSRSNSISSSASSSKKTTEQVVVDEKGESEEEIVFLPVKSPKNKRKRIYDTSDTDECTNRQRTDSTSHTTRRKRNSSSVSEFFEVKQEFVIDDDDIEIVDE